jgi:hypothetical protein
MYYSPRSQDHFNMTGFTYNFKNMESLVAYGVDIKDILDDDDVKQAHKENYYFWENQVVEKYRNNLKEQAPQYACDMGPILGDGYLRVPHARVLKTWPPHPILAEVIKAKGGSRDQHFTTCQQQVLLRIVRNPILPLTMHFPYQPSRLPILASLGKQLSMPSS